MNSIEIYDEGKKFVNVNELHVPDYHKKDSIAGNEKLLNNYLSELGVKAPLIINTHPGRENYIVNGVAVYKSCIKRGIQEVPVWEVDLPLHEEKQLHCALNTQQGEISAEHLLKLLGLNYFQYFDTDLFIETARLDVHQDIMADGQKTLEEAPDKAHKYIKSIIYRCPSELFTCLDEAMTITGCSSYNKLFSYLLKQCVEGGIK